MSRGYDPYLLYTRDPVLRRVLDQLKAGFRDGVSYEDLYQRLLFGVDCPADRVSAAGGLCLLLRRRPADGGRPTGIGRGGTA